MLCLFHSPAPQFRRTVSQDVHSIRRRVSMEVEARGGSDGKSPATTSGRSVPPSGTKPMLPSM